MPVERKVIDVPLHCAIEDCVRDIRWMIIEPTLGVRSLCGPHKNRIKLADLRRSNARLIRVDPPPKRKP